MSEKSTAYLRLTKKEARALLGWFLFQEHAHREEGEPSTITSEEVHLLSKIRNCIIKMNEEPERHMVMRLAPQYCKIVYEWYGNLPECLIDDIDADIHASLGMFLSERSDEEIR